MLAAAAAFFLGGCGVILFGPRENEQDEELNFDVTLPELWPIKAIDEGRTAVPLDAIHLRGIHWDVLGSSEKVFPTADTRPWFALLRADDQSPHPFSARVDWLESGSVTIEPEGGLDPDTRYLLTVPDCTGLQPHVLCPPPISFSTASAPRVLGVWRASDTLLLVFSEPMDPDTLQLAHDAVDLAFEQDGATYTVVGDLNLDDFTWSTEGRVFSLAPLSDLPVHVLLGPTIRSATGVPLDVDGDGVPDPETPFVHHVYPTLLELCWTRDDLPAPCATEDMAATAFVTYTAAVEVAMDLTHGPVVPGGDPRTEP